jgi:type I restriction enzyme, S subunit
MTEQEKIVSILSKVDASTQTRQKQMKKLEILKKGLMQKLLTGKIRFKA